MLFVTQTCTQAKKILMNFSLFIKVKIWFKCHTQTLPCHVQYVLCISFTVHCTEGTYIKHNVGPIVGFWVPSWNLGCMTIIQWSNTHRQMIKWNAPIFPLLQAERGWSLKWMWYLQCQLSLRKRWKVDLNNCLLLIIIQFITNGYGRWW